MSVTDYLNDPQNVKSSGRLFAAYLVAIGILAYPVGVFLPAAASYTSDFTTKCLAFASVFYGSTKVYDMSGALRDKLASFFSKNAAPEPKTGTTTGEL